MSISWLNISSLLFLTFKCFIYRGKDSPSIISFYSHCSLFPSTLYLSLPAKNFTVILLCIYLKAVKPGADINENGRSFVLRTTNPFLFVTQNLCTRSRRAGPAQNSQQSSSSVQKIPNHFQVFLNETNIF